MSSRLCVISPLRIVTAATMVLGLSLLTSTPVVAQWRVEPSIGVGVEYDDNATLSPDSQLETSLNGYAVEANAKFTYRSQRTEFSIDPKIALKRYNDLSAFDVNDAFLKLGFERTGLKSRFQLRGNFREESTRTAERSQVDFDIEEPDEILADDSGVLETSERQNIRLTPEWSYRVGQRTSVQVGGTYLDVSYNDNVFDQFTDFTATEIGAAIDFDWTERDTIGFGGYSRNSDFDRNDNSVSGYGAGLRYRRNVSGQTRVEIDLGLDRTEGADGVDQSNSVGGVSILRKLETGRLLATYQRRVAASGSGAVSVRDIVNVSGNRNLSERFSIGLGVRAYQTEAVEGNVTNFDERDYVQFRALFSWRATRDFTVDFDYRYTKLDRQSLTSDADSNQFNLWFRYTPIL